MIELVLGGARSGKSRYAELQAINSGKHVIYLATAEARDNEMEARINVHQQRRPHQWETIEEPIYLAEMIKKHDQKANFILVDCLTLWMSNLLFNKQGELQKVVFEQQINLFLNALSSFSGHIILVTNEIGQGVVSMDKMTRLFVDEAGVLHQRIASLSDRVVLVTVGIPQVLK